MARSDRVERVFLGGDRPALHAAADWLLRELTDGPAGGGDGGASLGEALIVVPGGQAERRLMELLAERSAGRALIPPTVVTLGQLTDRLRFQEDETDWPAASAMTQRLVWASVLREAEAALISEVLPSPPALDDWPGWWSLSKQIMQAADELGAMCLRVRDVADRIELHSDQVRWRALGELSARCDAKLAELGLVDRHSARLGAIEQRLCDWPGRVVLLATADLQPVHRLTLEAMPGEVTALIAADREQAEGFDKYGGFVPGYWAERLLPIEDEMIAFVDQPADQSSEVLRTIAAWSADEAAGLDPDRITVGLGDESMSGAVQRTLELAGVPARVARGQPIAQARPMRLLRALSNFADGGRFDALAALLRHPDAEQAITRRADVDGGEGREALEAAADSWLTLLDRYATEHLAARPTEGWLGDDALAHAMKQVYQSAVALLPEQPTRPRPLCEWIDPIGAALAEVYGQAPLSRHSEPDRGVVFALDAIGSVLERIDQLDDSAQPSCTYTQAVALLIDEASSASIPDPGGQPSVELVGFLELLLDDAPHLVITGLNEQHVPAPPRHSPLISEGLRNALGLTDDQHRLARDAYAISAMLAWRRTPKPRLVAGKRSAAGDPLMPSRLLLQADDSTHVQRVARLVDDDAPAAARPPLLRPGPVDRFLIPEPLLPPQPITRLRVTAFRDYFACPYRFYLKHVLKLEAIDDASVELSAGGFGTLAHRTLACLARADFKQLNNPDDIAKRLGTELDRVFHQSFGRNPPVAAQIQREQIRYRLHAFAAIQAQLVNQGWQTVHAEASCSARIIVDDQPFTITGQIDRIDHHPELGYRLIDYKTANTAKKPKQTHHQTIEGQLTWVDLQLPLYRHLAEAFEVPQSAQLGYINLPKKVEATGYAPADWTDDQLKQADAERDRVIRAIRNHAYWPPNEPNEYDGFARLCADQAADRLALIQRSSRTTEGGRR